ncbi:hypothetical protein AX17_001907 [Amanita inopinata Kibby_2008]|nr:hypothetical protein AX17_001907 [Amanita inopinata Kibby_2008]
MSQTGIESTRPTMRRKSSAQNLLSSFKSSGSSASPSFPAPIAVGTGSLSAATGFALAAAAQTSTPTASTPPTRDWDAQSLHSDGVSNSLAGAGSPPLVQGTSVDILRELIHKRIITLTYIRSIHEGRSHWFHTILITRADLDRAFNNNDMKKRSLRYAMLGMSLSNLLDMTSAQDLLRGLTNIMNEFDQSKEDNDKPKMRPTKRFIWKNAKNTDAVTEGTYLMGPHIPFVLDYHETLLSLLDIISEVYNRIFKLLGPSPFPHSQHYMGPLGLLSPHPGVSYLFSGENTPSHQPQNYNGAPSRSSTLNLSQPQQGNGGAYPTAAPSLGVANTLLHGGALGSPPIINWSASWGDMVLKADSKIKKITTSLLKELDQLARNGIKDELTSLDPLLRNLTGSEDGFMGMNTKTATDSEGL